MAKNPTTLHQNKHTLYMATSGGGKSQAMGQNLIKLKAKRVIFWDTHEGFKADRYSNLDDFAIALDKCINKKTFRIAYTGESTPEIFNEFCRMMFSDDVANGNNITYISIDEIAEVCESIGKDKTPLGELMRGGRKYGLRVHCAAIRSAEIPKTVLTQSETKWIGSIGSSSDAKVMADNLMIKPEDILSIEKENIPYDAVNDIPGKCFYWVKEPGLDARKEVINTKKPPL